MKGAAAYTARERFGPNGDGGLKLAWDKYINSGSTSIPLSEVHRILGSTGMGIGFLYTMLVDGTVHVHTVVSVK